MQAETIELFVYRDCQIYATFERVLIDKYKAKRNVCTLTVGATTDLLNRKVLNIEEAITPIRISSNLEPKENIKDDEDSILSMQIQLELTNIVREIDIFFKSYQDNSKFKRLVKKVASEYHPKPPTS